MFERLYLMQSNQDCEIWFVRFSMDKNQKIMALGNQIGRTYVWDMDVEEPSLIKHTLLSHPKVFYLPNYHCHINGIKRERNMLHTSWRGYLMIKVPFTPEYHNIYIIPFILPVHNRDPSNQPQSRWKYSHHCLRRWNCLEVNIKYHSFH